MIRVFYKGKKVHESDPTTVKLFEGGHLVALVFSVLRPGMWAFVVKGDPDWEPTKNRLGIFSEPETTHDVACMGESGNILYQGSGSLVMFYASADNRPLAFTVANPWRLFPRTSTDFLPELRRQCQ